MHEQFDERILCVICSDIILTPARLACNHEFCCYCIRSIKYKRQSETILCPLCRSEEVPAGMDEKRGLEVINQVVMNRKDIRIFYGHATTINHYDKNETKSRPFYILLKGSKLHGDIIWGGGSEHSTYLEEVGRLDGNVKLNSNLNIELADVKCFYSNSPYEDWKGTLEFKGNREYSAEKSIYVWFGWGRESSGDLLLNLRELQQGKSLIQQGIK